MTKKSQGGENLHRLLRFSAIMLTFVSIVVFILIFLAELIIPDKITVVEDRPYETPKFFGIHFYQFDSDDEINVIMNEKNIENSSEIKILNIIPVKNTVITSIKRKYVTPGGELFGIKMYTDGVIVVDTDDVETDDGVKNPADDSGIKVGDIIKKINGISVSSTNHLSKLLQSSNGKKVKMTIERDGKELIVDYNTYKETVTGKYRAGLWVRDSTAGLGTITFYNPENGSFGGLGHAIYDVDTNELMPIKNGEISDATVNGLYKSSKGNVGELCGLLKSESCGKLCINSETGVYGFTKCRKSEQIPVAVNQEIEKGKAQIICTVNDETKYYDVEIMRIFSNSNSVNKDMIIKVTDEELIGITGGIVQGMSGSPIIQNGMLVGAVTHVFVNNPTQGYAIFAERMLETSTCQEMKRYEQKQAS